MGIENELIEAIEQAHRSALIATIRGNPELTLAALTKLCRHNGLGSITVGEIVGHNASARASKAPSRAVDTRTPRARREYDAATFEALVQAGSWSNAQYLRARVGGTALQVRKALARLIDSGHVQWRGQARATQYRAAGGRRSAAAGNAPGVDTRTESGRNNYDQAVLSTLNAHGEMNAEQLRATVGGTPNQLRASVHRLIDAGAVEARGRARATKYRAG